jgi:hypothetical protein
MDKLVKQSEDGDDFGDRVADIQRELGESITKAGLQRDSYRFVLDVQSRVIGLFPDLVANIAAARQPLNDEVVLRKIAAAVSEKIVDMAVGEVVRSVDRLVIQRWRWIVATAAALMVAMLALGGVAGYEVLSHTTPCNDQVDGSRVCGWYERRPTPPIAATPEATPTTKPTSH